MTNFLTYKNFYIMKKILLLLAIVLLTGCSSWKEASTTADIEHGPNSFAKAIEGRETGVLVNTSGDPTESPSLLIRGISSLNASTEPLYIVDGMPYDGPINMINPNDIESVKVLKDPSETAIYGMRGGNGVVVIKTKKGNTTGQQQKGK